MNLSLSTIGKEPTFLWKVFILFSFSVGELKIRRQLRIGVAKKIEITPEMAQDLSFFGFYIFINLNTYIIGQKLLSSEEKHLYVYYFQDQCIDKKETQKINAFETSFRALSEDILQSIFMKIEEKDFRLTKSTELNKVSAFKKREYLI